MLDFGYPLSTRNGILCCNYKHPLLLKCYIVFLRCIRIIGWASNSIYKPLMVHTVSFLPKTNFKFHAKYQILGTL